MDLEAVASREHGRLRDGLVLAERLCSIPQSHPTLRHRKLSVFSSGVLSPSEVFSTASVFSPFPLNRVRGKKEKEKKSVPGISVGIACLAKFKGVLAVRMTITRFKTFMIF